MSETTQSDDVNQLLRAAGQGDLVLVRKIMTEGVSVNATNDAGATPLMAASAGHRVEVVTYLLEAGADVKLKSSTGQTALHTAVKSTPTRPPRQQECVRILLEHGSEIDAQDQSNVTPLMNAAWFGCTLAVQELLGRGASTTLRDAQGRTAEDLAKKKRHQEILALLSTKQ